MAWISVTGEGDRLTWREWVTPADFGSEHFRGGLADRIGWAVDDAEATRPDDLRPALRERITAPSRG